MPQKTWILTTTVVWVSEPSLMKNLDIMVSSYDGSALECRNFLWKKWHCFKIGYKKTRDAMLNFTA